MTESWGFPCSTKPQTTRSLQFTASWRLRGRSGWTDPCASSLERLRCPSFQSTGTRISFAPSLALRGRHSAARHRRHHGQGHQTHSSMRSSSPQLLKDVAPEAGAKYINKGGASGISDLAGGVYRRVRAQMASAFLASRAYPEERRRARRPEPQPLNRRTWSMIRFHLPCSMRAAAAPRVQNA